MCNDKIFEENFPSLIGKINYGDDGYGSGSNNPKGYDDWVEIEDIKNDCLDKQRVKEIIMKYFLYEKNKKDGNNVLLIGMQPFESMLVELGLR